MVTLFPLVRSLTIAPTGDWKTQPLLQTSDTAWLETGDINAGSVEFDGKDIKGPLTIGATLTRQYKPAADDKEGKPHPQRIALRSEEHTSELQSLMRISYAVFCLKKKQKQPQTRTNTQRQKQQ